MVLAFLRAEIASPRFGEIVRRCLGLLGSDRRLIDNADVADVRQNGVRKELLGCFRGYGKDAFLFRGFPNDTKWRRVVLDAKDLHTLLYAKEASWIEFSDGTRLVSVGAMNADKNPMGEGAKAVATAVRQGMRFPELIVVQSDGDSLILVEGATRATAYVLAESKAVEVLVGSSAIMARWAFY